MYNFRFPVGIATDTKGNLYITDNLPGEVIKIDCNGLKTTLFKGNSYLSGIAVDSFNNVYFSDNWNHRILKINTDNSIFVFAGGVRGYLDEYANTAMFNFPEGLAFDTHNNLYIADSYNHAIRKICLERYVSTVPEYNHNFFNKPWDLVVAADQAIYVADKANNCIKKINTDSTVTTVVPAISNFKNPTGITIGIDGYPQVADYGNNCVKVILEADNKITNKPITFCKPQGIATDLLGNTYITDTSNKQIYKINSKGLVTILK